MIVWNVVVKGQIESTWDSQAKANREKARLAKQGVQATVQSENVGRR